MSAASPHAAVQPNVDELLAQHAAAVAALRAALGEALPASWDDIWLLRFVLSFGNTPAREAAARRCIAWRAENAGMLADAAAGRPAPKDDAIRPHVISGCHAAPSVAGEPLFVVRAGLTSPQSTLAACSTSELLTWLMYQKELAFIRCDAETRRRRVLVKMISIVDLTGTTLAHGSETRFQKTVGDSGKLSEDVYPQLLARSVIIHPPFFFWALFSLFKVFASAKILAKLGVCPGRSPDKPSASACPFASARFRMEQLPTFLGGTCRCTAAGGCVCGVPNDRTAPAVASGTAVSVGAGAAHEVALTARAPGDRLAWEFRVEDKGLEVSAWVTPETGPPVTLLAARKFKADDGAVTGVAVVPVAGAVTMKFDNSHSRFTGKSVKISAAILPATLAAEPPADAAT